MSYHLSLGDRNVTCVGFEATTYAPYFESNLAHEQDIVVIPKFYTPWMVHIEWAIV